jgi:acyl-CoA hydrolase
MSLKNENEKIEPMKKAYPEKFVSEQEIFSRIHRGDHIFISTACGEPQYLVRALIQFVESNPKAFFDAEVIHVWSLGVAPYTEEKFKSNFRQNSFFVGNNSREAVNRGMADYTPIFLSRVPELISRGLVPIHVALIQTSPPDEHGYMSLGVSVDIVKAAVESAKVVIAQVNSHMPRVHGDGFIHIKDVAYILCHDEPLLEYEPVMPDEVAHQVGQYVARIVQDGETIQVGYGSLPNAILANFRNKKNLGVHSELLTDGMVELIQKGVIDNSRKTLNRGKTVATFCMGHRKTYEFIHDNPSIEFRRIDYTNSAITIARQQNMTAINSALEDEEAGKAVAIGQYGIIGDTHTAEVALVVRDDFQNKGIGTELLSYLTYLAKRAGLLGFTAEVLVENKPMQHLFEKMGFDTQRRTDQGVYELKMAFK